jgi:hypothetical protein
MFYEHNRSSQQAPRLMAEEDRLRREVDVRQEIYLTLNREYETARIDEVNDVPVITVIDPAVPPAEKSSPKRGMLAILAFVGGGVVAVVLAFGAEHADRLRREDDGEYRELRGRLRGLRADLTALVPGRRGRRESGRANDSGVRGG